jgi:hypothetical protein
VQFSSSLLNLLCCALLCFFLCMQRNCSNQTLTLWRSVKMLLLLLLLTWKGNTNTLILLMIILISSNDYSLCSKISVAIDEGCQNRTGHRTGCVSITYQMTTAQRQCTTLTINIFSYILLKIIKSWYLENTYWNKSNILYTNSCLCILVQKYSQSRLCKYCT